MSGTILTVVDQVLCLSKTIKEQQSILAKNFSTPEAELLDRIPGVGIDSAIGMMIEIENIERFPSVKKIASYFGLHPVFKESGDKGEGYRMSKKGRHPSYYLKRTNVRNLIPPPHNEISMIIATYCGAQHRWVKNLLKNPIILRIKKLKGSKALFFYFLLIN